MFTSAWAVNLAVCYYAAIFDLQLDLATMNFKPCKDNDYCLSHAFFKKLLIE